MGAICWVAWYTVSSWLHLDLVQWLEPSKINSLVAVLVIIPAGVFVYGSGLWLLQLEDLQAVKDLLFRWKRSEPKDEADSIGISTGFAGVIFLFAVVLHSNFNLLFASGESPVIGVTCE